MWLRLQGFVRILNALRHSCQQQRLSRFDDIEFNENVKPFIYKCREHVLKIASSKSSFHRGDYDEFAELCLLSFLTLKKENTKSHSSDLEHFIRPGGWLLSCFTLSRFVFLNNRLQTFHAGRQTETDRAPGSTTQQQVAKGRLCVLCNLGLQLLVDDL